MFNARRNRALARVCQPLASGVFNAAKTSLSNFMVTWLLFDPRGRPLGFTSGIRDASHVLASPLIAERIAASSAGVFSLYASRLIFLPTLYLPFPKVDFLVGCSPQWNDAEYAVIPFNNDNDNGDDTKVDGAQPQFPFFLVDKLTVRRNGKISVKFVHLLK